MADFTKNKSLHKFIYPQYIINEDCWIVSTPTGLEKGCIEYVLSELCHRGLCYGYSIANERNHSHTFQGVLEELVKHPKEFSIMGFEDAYSSQEKFFIETAKAELLKRKDVV